MCPLDAIEGFGCSNVHSGSLQPTEQRVQIIHHKRRMGFAGRSKVLFDAEMDAHRAGLEPAPTAAAKRRRLLDSAHPELALVEGNGLWFAARWHSELDMVDS